MKLSSIKGVSDKREAEFNKLGIFDTDDLIKFYPRRYLDLTERQPLSTVYHNEIALTVGRVISVPNNYYTARKGFIKVICEQEGLYFTCIWFNQPYVLSKLTPGEDYLFYGRVQRYDDVVSMVNPSFELLNSNYRLKGIVPQYQTKTLPQKTVRDAVKTALLFDKKTSIIPNDLQKKYNLSDYGNALSCVHNPPTFDALEKASERIAVEEYFGLISALQFIKGSKQQPRINNYNVSAEELKEFISGFPFEFTEGQKNAVNDIFSDMKSPSVMNRLLQGDVGSGKTAVCLTAVFVAVKSGYQAVILSPTEVLATQTYNVAKKFFGDFNVSLLVGSMKASEKSNVKKDLVNGNIQILVGTHAILEDNVVFKNLSLCVCDEQQRFGVSQRSVLSEKGDFPDVLVMSATPIPRTLSLIFFGDLDITTILDKPKNRLPVQTNIVFKDKYFDMLKYIRSEVKTGKQAYFVCPKIEGDEEGEMMSVTELKEKLSSFLPDVSFGLLHGKMKDAEKNKVMSDFKDGKIECLVSTTVIEVGVDVPNASIMVIYNAERFGLSQLHQLRGRVGRSDIKSYCFLLSESDKPEAIERLKVIKDNSDGFKISEADYSIRGGGDFLGFKQSGKFMTDLGNLRYKTDAIFLAKKISDEFYAGNYDREVIKNFAINKYEKLKDISLN